MKQAISHHWRTATLSVLTVTAIPSFAALEVPCWRGATNTTYQNWGFTSDASPAAPEEQSSPGNPTAVIQPGLLSSGWFTNAPALGTPTGFWDLGTSGSVSLTIPEVAGSANGYRYVVVQQTGYKDGSIYELPLAGITGGSLVSSNRTGVETNIVGGVWTVERTVWRLTNAPGSEVVTLVSGAAGALLDQVVVDTLTVDVPTPANLVLNADVGQCTRSNVTWTVAVADGCVLTNVVDVPASGSTFPSGTTLVTSTIYDSLGGNKSFNFTVTVNDVEAPVVICPADMLVAKGAGLCGAIVNFTPSAMDNCAVTNITAVPASGSEFPLGVTMVTCQAQDSSGNLSAPCQFTVRVVDASGDLATVPCWRGASNATYQHFAFSTGSNPSVPEWTTNASGVATASIVVGILGEGWLDEGGVLGCRQGFWDMGSFGAASVSIPEVAGSANGYRYVVVQQTGYKDGSIYELPLAGIAGGSLVSSNRTGVETNIVGGVWTVERTVWRLTNAPGSEVVTLMSGASGALLDQVVVDTLTVDVPTPANLVLNADVGQCTRSNVTWTVAVADGCVLTNVVDVPASGSTFPSGTTLVTSTIYDSLGGNKTFNFTVTVNDVEAPVVICPADMLVAKGAGLCGAIVNFTPSAMDNCAVTNITAVPASGSEFPLGVTMVTCQAQDSSGNLSAPCQFTVRVVDASGDLATVPCWRGASNATYQHFAFSTGSNPSVPEWTTNASGVATASIVVGILGEGWLDEGGVLGCRQGFWDMGSFGAASVSIPEVAGSANGYRYVVVQQTGYKDGAIYELPLVSMAGGSLVSSNRTGVETNIVGGVWTVERTVWRLTNAPGSEVVTLMSGASGALLDQVVVDTLTVDFPCPSDIFGVADLGQCSKSNVTWTVVEVDGCTLTNVVSIPPSGSSFPIGVSPVTNHVTDALGGVKTCVFNVVITDSQAPIISSIGASQVQAGMGTVDVTACASSTLQGQVNIAVAASDNCSLVDGHPSVTLSNGIVGELAIFVNESPAGVFNYSWTVGITTLPGTWSVTASASDTANTSTLTSSLCVDISQITGLVELERFVGTNRVVTFTASGGVSNRVWALPISFTGAQGGFALSGIPTGTTHLSAKTAWSLRRRLAVAFDMNLQAVVNFVSASKLAGGDLNGNNIVSGDDVTLLNADWQTFNPGGDIDGNGQVDGDDYDILSSNWLSIGDSP